MQVWGKFVPEHSLSKKLFVPEHNLVVYEDLGITSKLEVYV